MIWLVSLAQRTNSAGGLAQPVVENAAKDGGFSYDPDKLINGDKSALLRIGQAV